MQRRPASLVLPLLCFVAALATAKLESLPVTDRQPQGTTQRSYTNMGQRALSKEEKNKSGEKDKGAEKDRSTVFIKTGDKKQKGDVTESSLLVESQPSAIADSAPPPLEADEAQPSEIINDNSITIVPPLESETSVEEGPNRYPTQAPHVSSKDTVAELTADAIPSEESGNSTASFHIMKCPLPGYHEFTIDETTKPFIRYALTNGNQTIVLSVTETCSYIIEDLSGIQDTVYSPSPLGWLDLAVRHFGGSPGVREEDIKFSGVKAPSILDIDFVETDVDVFEVVVSGASSAHEAKPISWIFLSEERAKEFEYFVVSLVRFAPEIFLTNESTNCQSGPICEIVGNSVCYHDPLNNNTFAIMHLNGDKDIYDDAFPWFKDCIGGALDCWTDTNNIFSYSPCPVFTMNGTSFTLTDGSDGPNEVTFQCPTADSVLLVAKLVQKLSIDPFHTLSIGGPNEPGSHHYNNTTDCMR